MHQKISTFSFQLKIQDVKDIYPKSFFLSMINFLSGCQVGLCLSYVTPIIGLLSGIMTTFTETEQEMVSVERIQQVWCAKWSFEWNLWDTIPDLKYHMWFDHAEDRVWYYRTVQHTLYNNDTLWTWQYMDVPEENDQSDHEVSPSWPVEGAVNFNHVSLIYRPGLPLALNDVSFFIQPREHVSYRSQLIFRLLQYF